MSLRHLDWETIIRLLDAGEIPDDTIIVEEIIKCPHCEKYTSRAGSLSYWVRIGKHVIIAPATTRGPNTQVVVGRRLYPSRLYGARTPGDLAEFVMKAPLSAMTDISVLAKDIPVLNWRDIDPKYGKSKYMKKKEDKEKRASLGVMAGIL